MRQWCWGCICSVAWKVRLTGIRILSAGPKLAFGQAAVNSVWSVELPQLPRPSNHHYFHHLKPKSHSHCSTYYFKPGALWNHPSSSSIIPFSSNLKRKCRTTPSSFQEARHLARMTFQPTSPPRRMSPPTTRGLLIIVLRGAPRRGT